MSGEEHCRICLDNNDPDDLISPCKCSGTLKHVHRKCFLHWLRERSRREQQFRCEICNTIYLDNGCWAGLWAYVGDNLNVREANRTTLALFVFIIHLYVLYYLLLSGPLDVVIHSAQVPDMDILLWEKSDAYAVVCLDNDCRCESEVRNDNNHPVWNHRCLYWLDKSAFMFSKVTFLLFDADIDHNDDFIGEVSTSIYRVLFNINNGKSMQLKWDVPYKATLTVTVQWTPNLLWLINHFL